MDATLGSIPFESPDPDCEVCGDSGIVDDDGPHEGCWPTQAFCLCEAGRKAQSDAEDAAFAAQERGDGF